MASMLAWTECCALDSDHAIERDNWARGRSSKENATHVRCPGDFINRPLHWGTVVDSHVAMAGSDGVPIGVVIRTGHVPPPKENISYKSHGLKFLDP